MSELQILKRRLERELLARKQTEVVLEEKALELHNANEALRKLNENLEQKITQRTFELKQAQLAEQQFLANMSHEIRTPMNSVIGMTHLLYETPLSAIQKDYVDALHFSAGSLMGLLNNILDLSKIEAGELELEEKNFNLQQLLKDLQRTFQFKLKDKSISVDIEFDPNISNLVIGDPTRLNQILTNLLGNASKFTEFGTIGISAKLQHHKKEKYWIEFQVLDTGIGIPADKLELIFKNFKQANTKITRKYGGTGLGLAIVKELVELQDGIITVQSIHGKGSTFKVILPFGNSNIKAIEKQPQYEKINAKVKQLLKEQYILVVEDNDMNQKLITKILEIWGCSFDLTKNGMEAVELTNQHKYDLILMDIHMPEMDGIAATTIIRNTIGNLNKNVPIIALTAAALLEEKNRAIKAGMNDFLAKPFSPAMLLEKIAKLLGFCSKNNLKGTPCGKKQETDLGLISLNYLYEFSNGDQTFVKEMVKTFIRETPNSIQELKEAFLTQNWESVYKMAHQLKPNFMMFGMKKQQSTAAEIEKLVKRKDYSEGIIQQLIIQLEFAVEQAYPILQGKLQEI